MKLLVDMNLSPRWVPFLAASQIEAAHWSTVGPVDAADKDIMAYAQQHGHVVLTNDLDFSAILAATSGSRPSVIQIRSDDLNPNAIGQSVVAAVKQLATQLQSGALVSVEPHRTKVRLLPL
jgi:predicted nuclease of predicted toxin-antitoxin system